MSRTLIVNAYVTGNHGDAAIVQGLIAALRSAGADRVAVAARSWRDEEREWLALGADEAVPPLVAVHDVPGWASRSRPLLLAYVCSVLARAVFGSLLRRPRASARAYLDADLIVSAGGGYLGGPKAGINFVKVANIWFGRVVRRPVVIAPMTIAPPRGLVRHILRWGMSGTRIFVRDEPSREILRRLGLKPELAPDLAFRAPAVRAALEAGGGQSTLGHGLFCWAPRSYLPHQDAWEHRESLEARSVEAVSQVVEGHGLRLRLIPQVSATAEDDDRQAMARIAAALPAAVAARTESAEPAGDLADAIGQFADCSVLLASRLHATLLALSVGVPSLAIAYDPKVTGVLGQIGLADRAVAPDASWSSADLAGRLEALLDPAERERSLRAINEADRGFEQFDAALRRALVRTSAA